MACHTISEAWLDVRRRSRGGTGRQAGGGLDPQGRRTGQFLCARFAGGNVLPGPRGGTGRQASLRLEFGVCRQWGCQGGYKP